MGELEPTEAANGTPFYELLGLFFLEVAGDKCHFVNGPEGKVSRSPWKA